MKAVCRISDHIPVWAEFDFSSEEGQCQWLIREIFKD
ncbi:hypothetical protein GIHI108528_08045 [Gillisia hiemivivida]